MNNETFPVSEKVRLTQEILTAIMSEDAYRAADLLNSVGERSTVQDMYGFCCAFAHAAVHALSGLSGLQAKDGMIAFQDLQPDEAKDPAQLFAIRFTVAYGNDDPDNALALFEAAVNATAEEYTASIAALALLAGEWLRLLEVQRPA